MTITPKHLGFGLVGATPTPIYSVPAAALSTTIRSITATNLTSSPHSITIWLVPASQPVGDSVALVKTMTVPANGVLVDDSVHVLESGGAVVAQGDVADVFSITVDGAQSTA